MIRMVSAFFYFDLGFEVLLHWGVSLCWLFMASPLSLGISVPVVMTSMI